MGPGKGDVRVEAAHPSHVRDETDAREVRDETVVLRHVADALADGKGARADVKAQDPAGARCGPQETEEKAKECRLACSVGSEEANRALGDPGREPVEGEDGAVAFRQAVGLDNHRGPS